MKRFKIDTFEGMEWDGTKKAQYKEYIVNLFKKPANERKLVFSKKFNRTIITIYI